MNVVRFGDVTVLGVSRYPKQYLVGDVPKQGEEFHLKVLISGPELKALQPEIKKLRRRVGNIRWDLPPFLTSPEIKKGTFPAYLGVLPNSQLAFAPGWQEDSAWIFSQNGGRLHTVLPHDISKKLKLAVRENLKCKKFSNLNHYVNPFQLSRRIKKLLSKRTPAEIVS